MFSKESLLPGRGLGLTREERATAYACLIGGAILFLGAVAFSVANLVQHHFPLAAFNLVGAFLGLSGLVAVRRRLLSLAVALIFGGNAFYSFVTAYFAGSGTDLLFLVFFLTGIYSVRSKVWRRLILGIVCVGYFVLALHHFDPAFHPVVTQSRILLNTAIGLVVLALFYDIFQAQAQAVRRELEEKNRQLAEANQAKEKIFSILSHDLCGPIGLVKEGLAYLEDSKLSPEENRILRSHLKDDIAQLYSTARGLLEWSAQQMNAIVPQFASTPLAPACGEAIALLRPMIEKSKVLVENRIDPAAIVLADGEQVRTLFRNLLSNSLKFTPSGGIILIEAAPQGGFVKVTVRDTGIGMAPELASRLFATGFRETRPGLLNEKGMGLGLSICRSFIEAHGGVIEAESQPGKGTAIHFTLPRLGIPESA